VSMVSLNKELLREMAGPRIYSRGRGYYLGDRVEIIKMDENLVEAQVRGTFMYVVRLRTDRKGTLVTECDCPYDDVCKHIVAVGLKIISLEEEKKNPVVLPPKPPVWEKRKKARVRRMAAWETYTSEVVNRHSPERRWQPVISVEIGHQNWLLTVEKAYIKKDGSLGRRARLTAQDLDKGDLVITPGQELVVSYILANSLNNVYSSYWYTPRSFQMNGYLNLPFGASCGHLFGLLRTSQVACKVHHGSFFNLKISDTPGQIVFRAEEKGKQIQCVPWLLYEGEEYKISEQHAVLTENPLWLLHEETLIQIENVTSYAPLAPFLQDEFTLQIPRKDIPVFLQRVASVPDIISNIDLQNVMEVQEVSYEPVPRIKLEENSKGVSVELNMVYGEHEFSASADEQFSYVFSDSDDRLLKVTREPEFEEEALDSLSESGVVEDDEGGLYLQDEQAIRWLLEKVPEFQEKGFLIEGEESLEQLKVKRITPKISAEVNSKIDWFDVKLIIDFDGIIVTMEQLQKALDSGLPYITLSDGSTVQIPEQWLDHFGTLMKLGQVEQENVRVSRTQVRLIEMFAEEIGAVTADAEYATFIEKLRNFEGIAEHEVPEEFKGKLRPYQKAGYDWLLFLQDFRFGGILADDMGLGKTVQTIVLLLHEKKRGASKPTLVVAPTSVVFNWRHELEKFAPGLRVLQFTGVDREKSTEQFSEYDVILTTYGTLRRDVLMLREFPFNYVILDESQNIKNPNSQTAKAVRLLTADFRLVLTGTPIENNTIELWSQFAFLNPGMLGSQRYFQTRFATPIEKKGDKETAAFLQKLVQPFLLRRTKEQVADELPPKSESIFYASMTAAQANLYNYWRDYYRAAVLQNLKTKGLGRSRFVVLEGLVKLRQIACHPQLIEPNTDRDSGKFNAMMEQLREIIAEGHKVLIFSQFVKMLTIMRKQLDAENIAYTYLDGRTRNREAKVQQFQENEDIPLFLISLRAGGTGLNLTAADYVFHFDPWWNPAVEMQATDRTHRIGQKRHVFVYKFITQGTVEEKVLQLQTRKKKLVDSLISTDAAFFKQLSTEDIETLFE